MTIPDSVPDAMRAIAISRPGGPDVLEPVTVPVPVPGPGEALIEVAAAGLNGPDVAQREGRYDPPPGASPLPGLEVSGTVVALGPGTETLAPGDRVVALVNGGGYARYVAVPASQVLPLPENWTHEEGATLPETFFTLAQTLLMRAGLEKDMVLLVHGASGGIGGAALQIGRALGARPIGVVSGPQKADYARTQGAFATIDRNADDLVARVKALSDGRGADRIIDMVGGATTGLNVDAAARGAHIVLLATLAGTRGGIPLAKMLVKQLTLSASTLRPQSAATKAAIADLLRARIWPLIASGAIGKPAITAFPLEQAGKAHAAMAAPGHFGKVVLTT